MTVDNDFRFDALLKLLKILSFGLLFAYMGFGLIVKITKIPRQRRSHKKSKMKLFIKTAYYLVVIVFAKLSILDFSECSEHIYRKDIIVSYVSVWFRYQSVRCCDCPDGLAF